MNGRGCQQDYRKVVACLKAAIAIADQDPAQAKAKEGTDNRFALAIYNLGVSYSEGKGVARDLVRAVELIERSAALGLPIAWTRLSGCYFQGDGRLSVSYAKALGCIEKAIALGETVQAPLLREMVRKRIRAKG